MVVCSTKSEHAFILFELGPKQIRYSSK